MTRFVYAATLEGTVQVKMNGSSVDFKPPEFTAHFNSKYTKCYVGNYTFLTPGVLLTNTETGSDSISDL